MIKIKEILNGHINELRALTGTENKDQEAIFSKRRDICITCPLKRGNVCDPNFVITDELEKIRYNNKTMKKVFDNTHPNGGYFVMEGGVKVYKGCGCRLSAKQRSSKSVCPAAFWGGEFNK